MYSSQSSAPPSGSGSAPTRLLRLVPPTGAPDARTLVEQAETAERQGRREDARALYEQALRRAGELAPSPSPSDLLRWIGRTYLADANYAAALDCAEAALASATAADDLAAVGLAVNLQAGAHWHARQLDEAHTLYLRAKECAVAAGEAKLAAMVSQNLGVIANIRGDVDAALRHYEASLFDYRALGLAKDVCVALNNLGLLHTHLGHWDDAERVYAEAVQISTVIGDMSARILLEVNLAELWIAKGTLDLALEACDKAMELSRACGDFHAEGETHKNYGIIARERGDHAVAEESFARAEQMAEERQDLLLLAEVAREKAELHRRQGRNRDLLQCLNRAHRLFEQLRAGRDLADVDRRMRRLEGEFLDVARRWGESIESKDRYTQGHCERVADIACGLATAAGLDEDALFWFRIGALLHDVGKLVVPPEVLNKPGKLTDEEWELVKRHPTAGVEMLADIEFPWDVLPIVQSHHERWDGRGYPHGLAGDAIPFSARILCIADVFDALTSERSYKRALSVEDAVEIMRRDVGRQFDPQLFPLFEDLVAAAPPAIRAVPPQPVPEPVPAPPLVAPRPMEEPAAQWPQHHADDLTGLPLRRAFLERAAEVLDSGRETGVPTALLVIDVDHFKLVNDGYGHLQGDDVLRGVATIIRRALRDGEVAGRYAGDEFVVLVPGATAEEARARGATLVTAVREASFPLRDRPGSTLGVTLSVGVASAPEHGASIEGLFDAADRGLYHVKRLGRNGVATAADVATASRPQPEFEQFVGRQEEFGRLTRLLETATAGAARIAAVVGEAGVGKSTLVRQLVPEVRLRGGAIVLGRCLEADVRPPYGPWAEVINNLEALGGSERSWREIPRLVPSLARGGAVPTEQSGSKYALFEEIAEYLRVAAERRPIVVVLDDMQWADAASWDTLEHVLSRLDGDRVLLCLTIRAEDANGDTAERRRRLSRDERYHEIKLSRLTRDELGLWVERALRQKELGRDLPDYLFELTEGNALFLVQVLRTMVDEGTIRFENGRWQWDMASELSLPVAVSELIARRIERLSAQARAVLTTAAVIGRTFNIDLAIAAGAGTEDELLDAVDEAVAAAVLEPVDHSGDVCSFAHTLLVDAIRASANPRRLRRIHEAVARALEERQPNATADIARHYDRSGNSSKAYEFATRAGLGAMQVYAHDDAIALLMMAQRHASTPAERSAVGQRLAEVSEAAGRYAQAQTLVEAVLDVHAAELSGEESLRLRRGIERLRSLQGHPSAATLESCRRLLAEAEAMQLEGERVALLTMISQAHMRLGDSSAAERIARDCVTMARAMADDALLADALTRLGTTLLEMRPAEAAELYDEAHAIFSRLDNRYGQMRCHINRGVALARVNDVDGSRAGYQAALDLGRTAHAPDLAGVASLNLGVMQMNEGQHVEAHEHFDEALRLFTATRNSNHELATLYNMGHLARNRGDWPGAAALYRSAGALARRIGHVDVELGALAGAGLASLALGEIAEAESALHTVEERIRPEWWFQGREQVEVLGVRLAAIRGESTEARRRFADALAFADRLGARHAAAWLVAECAHALADIAPDAARAAVLRYQDVTTGPGLGALAQRFAQLASALQTDGVS